MLKNQTVEPVYQHYMIGKYDGLNCITDFFSVAAQDTDYYNENIEEYEAFIESAPANPGFMSIKSGLAIIVTKQQADWLYDELEDGITYEEDDEMSETD